MSPKAVKTAELFAFLLFRIEVARPTSPYFLGDLAALKLTVKLLRPLRSYGLVIMDRSGTRDFLIEDGILDY